MQHFAAPCHASLDAACDATPDYTRCQTHENEHAGTSSLEESMHNCAVFDLRAYISVTSKKYLRSCLTAQLMKTALTLQHHVIPSLMGKFTTDRKSRLACQLGVQSCPCTSGVCMSLSHTHGLSPAWKLYGGAATLQRRAHHCLVRRCVMESDDMARWLTNTCNRSGDVDDRPPVPRTMEDDCMHTSLTAFPFHPNFVLYVSCERSAQNKQTNSVVRPSTLRAVRKIWHINN